MTKWLGLFLVLMAAPASAQTDTPDCRELTTHAPDADVAYVPGMDVVDGEPVVPADIEGAPAIAAPQDFDIEIDVELADQVPGANFDPEAKVGRVEVRDLQGETKIGFNGQPLYRGGPQALSKECAE